MFIEIIDLKVSIDLIHFSEQRGLLLSSFEYR